MKADTTIRNSERGSVLIYIFIAVAVLAALTFAVSRSGRESAETINRERADLWATELLDYSNMLRRSVQTITVSGSTENDLCFDDAGWDNNDYDHTPCATPANRVFGPTAGGATFQRPNVNLFDTQFKTQPGYGKWMITGANSIKGVGSDCSPTGDCNELMVVLPYLRLDACTAVNARLSNTPSPETPPPQDDAGFDLTAPFVGTYPDGDIVNTGTLDGKRIGCFQGDGGPTDDAYVFYSVLIAR